MSMPKCFLTYSWMASGLASGPRSANARFTPSNLVRPAAIVTPVGGAEGHALPGHQVYQALELARPDTPNQALHRLYVLQGDSIPRCLGRRECYLHQGLWGWLLYLGLGAWLLLTPTEDD